MSWKNKNYSSINGEFIKYMVQNNNSEEVTTYRTELQCVEKQNASMKLDHSNKIKEISAKAKNTYKISVNTANKIKMLEESSKKINYMIRKLQKKE